MIDKKKVLKWTPRTLGILYVLFVSMFAFDVFGEYNFPEVLLALLMHLIPSLILVAILILAWKKPMWGGIAYIILAVAFTIFFKAYEEILSLLFLIFPLLIVGVLFIIESKKKIAKNK